MTNPRFSIVIPTHNRHELLFEALRSIAEQTCDDWEAIIVDDGSTLAVSENDVRKIVGNKFTLHRHDQPLGVAAARTAGYGLASGEFIAQVDDDDLLASTTLEKADAALRHEFAPEVLYIGIDAFGAEGDDVNARQRRTLDTVLEHAKPMRSGSLCLFDDSLFKALLRSVPIAFQKPIWHRSLLGQVQAMRADDWPESAWAIEAAARSIRSALLDLPLYRWRRDGQSYFSVSSQHQSAMLGHINMKSQLLKTLGRDLPVHRGALRRALAKARFDYCYNMTQNEFGIPWRQFFLSVVEDPKISHLKLLYRSIARKKTR